MTDLYNDDRGLSAGKWKTLVLRADNQPPTCFPLRPTRARA